MSWVNNDVVVMEATEFEVDMTPGNCQEIHLPLKLLGTERELLHPAEGYYNIQ